MPDAQLPSPRVILEFDSPAHLSAYVAAREGVTADAVQKVLVNNGAQSIKLRGSQGTHNGQPAIIIEVVSRGEEGDDLIPVAPGDRVVI